MSRKTRHKKVWQSVISCVLAFALAFSMTVPAFASPNNEVDEGGETINYVSIGDSMANGYCFEGYEQGEGEKIDFLGTKGLNPDGIYGEGAYPLQFQAYLEGKGYTVNHTKLALSAERAEDLNYLLGGREEPTDGWQDQVNGYSEVYDDIALAAHFQKAVEEADIITLGIGNASFGAYMLHRVTDALHVFGAELDEDEKVTIEDALAILEPEEQEILLEAYNEMEAELDAFIPAELGDEYDLDDIKGVIAYTFAGFLVNYEDALDRIIELNHDATIIQVGLMNTTYGMIVTDENLDDVPVGDIMDDVFAVLNAYVAGLPVIKQADGEWLDATFLYAEQPNPLFISQQFAALKEANWANIDKGRLSGDIVRDRNITAYNETLREVIGSAFGLPLPETNLEMVKAFDAADKAAEGQGFFYAYSNYGELAAVSTAIYLGIEDAVAASTDTMEIPLSGLKKISGELNSVFEGLDGAAMWENPGAMRSTLGNFLTSTDELKGMCKIYALFKVGNGMSVHPTPAGHDELFAEVVKAYEEGITAEKETDQNLRELYNFLESNAVSDKMQVELLKKLYSAIEGNASESEASDLAMIAEIYSYLSDNGYITDAQTMDIVLCAYAAFLLEGEELEGGVVEKSLTDAEVVEIVKFIYETLLGNGDLEDADRIAIIGNIYTILKNNNKLPVAGETGKMLTVAEGIYYALSEKDYLTDEQSFAIVDFIYALFADDDSLDADDLRLIAIFVYYTMFEHGEAMPIAFDEVNIDDLTAAQKLDMIATVLDELEAADLVAAGTYPQVDALIGLFEDLTQGEDPLLTAEQAMALVDAAFKALVVEEKSVDEAIEILTQVLYNDVLADSSVSIEKKLAIVELFGTALSGLAGIEGSGSGDPADVIAAIVEHMAAAKVVVANLKAAGLLTDEQATDIIVAVYPALMSGEAPLSTEAIAELIDEVYRIALFGEDPALTPEQRNQFALIVLATLEEQGYIGEEQAIDLLDPYYQEAVADVLTAEVVDLIVKGIDAASAAVKAAQIAAEAYADSDLKDALLAELAATLETLDVARDIFADGDLNDLRGAMAAMLELKGELDKHAVTISALAEEAGIAAEPYIVEALKAADAYIALADETIAEIYAAAVEACEDFTAAYAAWVEDMAARAAAIDPALGDAVRAFLTEVPADSLAILYAYGDEALTKLVADAAVAYGDIYDIVAALAQVLYADGEAIYNAVLASDDFAAVKAEIEGLLADIAAMIEAAKMAPATTIVGYEEKLAELYDRLFDSYEKLYPIVLDAMDQVDPTLRPMVEKLVDALYEALNVSSAFVGAYGEWLPGHANAMAGALLSAFLENWGEFAPVAGPIAGELAVELATELGRYLLAELVRALPGIDAALYDWFYNNPDKVCGFFAEYGDDMGAFFADNYEIILGILGYIAMEFGDEAVEYVLANPEECLTALVNWYNTYGDRIWAMIDVYMNYLGVYDAIEAEIAVLEAELADLKAELEKAAGEMDAALKAEIEKQIAAIEKQIAALEKALDELEAAILAGKTAVEAQIEALKAIADALKGDVEALIALVEQIGSDAEAMKAAAVAICAEIAKLLGSDWADKAFEQILAFLKEASPKVDQALYDWFYNNPDKTVAFFTEYGDEFVEHGDAILAVLGYIAMEFGDEALEYVIANPEQSLDALVQWYETYGYRIWPMVNVYLEYLGVYDAIEAEIAVLEAELADLKAELEKAAGEMDAALKAEIEKQIAEIEKQIAALEKALDELEAAILAFQAGVEDQIEALIAHVEAKVADLKAAIEELEAMARQLNAEIQAAIAELKAAIEAIEAATKALIEDASKAAEAIDAFFEQIAELLGELKAALEAAGEDALADAVHGEYAIDSDASYVALGDATIVGEGSYADQVAAFMANLAGSKGVQSNYEKVAIADDEDLVATVADMLAAVESGELDEVLANAGLVTVSAGAEDLTVSIVYQLVDVLSAFALSSLNEAESNDWASLVGAEGAAAVEQALAALEAELVKQLGDEATASMAVKAIEAVAFAYANFSVNYVKLLDAVQVAAPEAHIVAVGLANALEGLTIDVDGFELAIGEYAGWVVEAADLEMLAYALLDEGGNVTFVSASEADCNAAAVISEVVEAALAIDFENDPEAVLELLPLVAEIVDSATWMPNEAGQAYIAEQILGAVDFVAVADAVYTAEAAQPSVAVAVDGVVVTDGYTVSSEAVEVTDEAVACVTLEDGCVIEATFAIEHLATVESFEDFGEPADGHWYLEEGQGSFAELRTLYMDYALATGLMSGYVNRDSGTITHFGPWDSLDRAQAATVIYRMANEDASATLDPAKYADNATAMADVEDGEYYTAAVNWCVENEIITGYLAGPNKGKFMPYNKVTRSELAAMVQRYCVNVCDVEMRSADVMGYEDSGLIDTTWALPGLEFCKAYGIMTGIHGKNELNPVGKANRAEAAKMFSVVGHDIL